MKTVLSQEVEQFQRQESVRQNNSSTGTDNHDNHASRPDETMSNPEDNGAMVGQEEPETSTAYDFTNAVGDTPMSLVELLCVGLTNPPSAGGDEELGYFYPAPNAVGYLADILDQAVEVAGFFDEDF